jgi:hypothetical protein
LKWKGSEGKRALCCSEDMKRGAWRAARKKNEMKIDFVEIKLGMEGCSWVRAGVELGTACAKTAMRCCRTQPEPCRACRRPGDRQPLRPRPAQEAPLQPDSGSSLVEAPQVAHGAEGGAGVSQRRRVLRRHLRQGGDSRAGAARCLSAVYLLIP